MSMQQFCLRWNNHQPNFISVFSTLLNSETLVDVTLAAEGRHLQAHKVVLSACSTYFQSLFTVNPCQHPIVILKDVKFSDLKIMVDFMYYGEVNISQDQLPSIIKTAESLKIKGLAEMHTASLTKWPSGSSEPGGGDRGESCSPSPSPLSPSFRRKRLRKSSTGSTSGSGDKPEEINEITLVATNIVKPEPLIVSQESGDNLRRPMNQNTESQGSIDEDQISIMSNMENSSAATTGQSDGSIQDVSQQSGGNVGQSSVSSQPSAHQGLQWTIMEHTYPRFALSSCQTNLSIQASSAFTTPEISASSTISDQYSGTSSTGSSCALTSYPNSSSHGSLQGGGHGSSGNALPCKTAGTKRGRLLMRQPRVKKEPCHLSPDSDQNSPHIVSSSIHVNTPTLNLPQASRSWEESRISPPQHHHHHHHHQSIHHHNQQPNLLAISSSGSTNLLTVPQPSYLMKQHSHPLLSSQQGSGSSGNYWIHRQHSNPEFPGRTSSPSIVIEPAPMIKAEEEGYCEETTILSTTDTTMTGTTTTMAAVTTATTASTATTTITTATTTTTTSTTTTTTAATMTTTTTTSSTAMQMDPSCSGNSSGNSSGNTLRVKTTELRRSSSSPQTTTTTTTASVRETSREGMGDQRLGHCPVLRPGPALGCNHCWNTIDAHGRTLRRKTKYHCPECQINLCIVPCFQEYHEQRHESKLKPLPKTSSV